MLKILNCHGVLDTVKNIAEEGNITRELLTSEVCMICFNCYCPNVLNHVCEGSLSSILDQIVALILSEYLSVSFHHSLLLLVCVSLQC